MSPDPERGGRRGVYVAAATTAALAITGVGFVASARPWQDAASPSTLRINAVQQSPVSTPSRSPSPETSAAAGTPGSAKRATTAPDEDFGPVLPGSKPVSLDIPSIDVHSDRLVDLAYTKDGELEVPIDYDLPGWFSPGPTPGQFGPAVIAGHVDSKKRPAVFYRLRDLKPGAIVKVGREDGTTATFTIDKVEQYPKNQFPTSKVYGNTTNRAELRLITCGGSFDKGTGHYRDNIVAYAHLTA